MAIFSGLTISGGGLTISGGGGAPVATDPYFMYNSLLLPGNGTNNAQNNTFLDGSTNNFTITRNGNTTQGTFSPYGGNWSNYFDGTGDYLSLASTSTLAFGTGDFCVEMYYYHTVNAGAGLFSNSVNSGGGDAQFEIQIDPVDLYPRLVGWASIFLTSSVASPLNTWNHLVVCRSGTTASMFLNGTRVATATVSNNFSSVNAFVIGKQASSGGTLITGYMSNVRAVKGSAVYDPSASTITVPTTPLLPITNTSLLTCADGRFIDDSINNLAITKNGDTSVQRFSPFNPSSVTPTSYSGYFDGTGDMIQTPSITIGTNAFCFECWLYPTVTQGTTTGIFVGSTTDSLQASYYGNPGLGIATKGTAWQLYEETTLPTVNAWNHVAFVRSGTGANQTSIYINGVRVANGTVASNFAASVYQISTTNAGGSVFQGYISNARLTNGSTPYDATQSTITVPTTPLTAIANTALLTCQSPTFIDNSTNNFAITANGNSQPTIQNPFGYTSATTEGYSVSTIGGSGYFDGTGDYISVPDNVAFTMGSGDFTIECWVNLTTLSGSQILIGTCDAAGNQGSMSFVLNVNSGTPRIGVGYGSTVYFATAASTINANTWVHIAGVRNGASVYVYVNGVQSTALDMGSLAINDSTQIVAIGRNGNYDGEYVTGYISDVRIIKGTAVYTSNFVPPSSPLTAITNTSLLANMTNAGIIDNAMMNDLETVGNAQISTTQSKFGGSSIVFDGTGDYLKAPYNPAYSLPGDFTVETWIYLTSAAGTGNQTIASFGYNNSTGAGPWGFYLNGTGPYTLYFNSSSGNHGSSTTVDIPINTWTHVTYCRSGTTGRFFVNGTIVGTTISDNFTYSGTTQSLFVGIMSDASSSPLYGYLDDLRITTGYARYTSNFSVPTEAFPTY